MSGLFLGTGRLLIACAEHWLSKGRQVRLVVSDCPDVSAWTKAKGISRIAPDELAAAGLRPGDVSYLFSIVNHAILPPEVLALPTRRAINYHDSPLPRYAGFNATAWAIMDGQTRHAVTWHEMTADVDGGAILVQQAFDIQDDDTSFSLGAKCVEAGRTAFEALVDLLAAAETTGQAFVGTPQGPNENFHLRSDRPSVGLIDFTATSAEVSAFVRALDLGSDDNWMCRPKIAAPGDVYIVGDISIDRGRGSTPGEVIGVDPTGITIATADGSVRCSRLSTLEGAPVDVASLGIKVGRILPAMSAAAADKLAELDAGLTKHERIWVKRLAAQRGPVLSTLRGGPGQSDAALIKARGALGRPEAVVAAFGAYLARVGEDATFDLALAKDAHPGVGLFYAAVAPMRFDVGLGDGFVTLVEGVRAEIAAQKKRGVYARDVVTRYAALRQAGADRPTLDVGLRFQVVDGLDAGPALVAGTHLTLVVSPDGANIAWAYDRRAITDADMNHLVARVEALLVSGLADPAKAVGHLDLLPAAERQLLTATWQDTAAPFANACIHELFEAQAARTPDAVALRFRNQSLSYRQLNQRADAVAGALRAKGVGPDVLVAICMERSIDLVVGLMGILKAGGAYVPLDSAYPRERLGMMLEDSKAPILLTQGHLIERLPEHQAEVVRIESLATDGDGVPSGAGPNNLAYVIFTSGSTGRPKGVMVQHGNVANFFVGMDEAIGTGPGVWLAVTSISFDISVLELFWTLTRGFEVVLQGESDRASLAKPVAVTQSAPGSMEFGLFYFAADQGGAKPGSTYRLLLEGAKFADANDFSAVWTPERHFHAFGGLYPNPAVTTAALATITSRIALRAGSVVLPLHNPLRVAEDWSVIDQLSGGRVGLSFASGWHANDFAFMPQNYERRREIMLESIDTVMKLWRGEKVEVENGEGKTISVAVLPRPLQEAPPIWIASAGSVATFELAGRLGANVLTNMLGQDLDDLRNKFAAYRIARREAGFEGPGVISVMLHTFVCEDTEKAREFARKPFIDYLTSSFDLIKVAPTMFPAFKRPSADAGHGLDTSAFTDEDLEALMDYAFDRYFETAGLFGSPENALRMVNQLKGIGATEVACLIDFGVDPEVVLESLPHLNRLRQLANETSSEVVVIEEDDDGDYSIAAQIRDRRVTHFQCTPSMARMLASDPESLSALAGLDHMLLGGEALPVDLIDQLTPVVRGQIHNMYGPTETTIWSTTSLIQAGEAITIGKPIANTVIRILDARGELAPIGTPGELCIGGAGVVRGYFGRPDLTEERFVRDPFEAAGRLYRTGDLARWLETGDIEFLGRLDHQVKVNGYRIELGEIETVLGRHPRVRQSVVVARGDTGMAQLVGYVIPNVEASGAGGEDDRVAQWQALWDSAYGQGDAAPDARFNHSGWTSSYTGDLIPAESMREWLDQTEASILALKPRRVLEIGCGTGMVLYRVMPHVDHYTGVDVSPQALEKIRDELSPGERAKVTLIQQPADALDGLAAGSFDTVVINSVCQYFPSAEYFVRVLKRAAELLAPGGRIFVGDVRSREHLDAFHALTVLTQAPSHLETAKLCERIEKRVAQEGELVLSEAFFHALKREIPGISAVDAVIKTGAADTEMNAFRYDVTLHFGAADLAPVLLPEPSSFTTLDAIRDSLRDTPPIMVFEDLQNARLTPAYGVLGDIASGQRMTAGDLRAWLATPGEGVDPATLASLDASYEAEFFWAKSGAPGRFDAVLRHKTFGPKGRIAHAAPAHGEAPASYANRPAAPRAEAADLFDDLRDHLREFLPEYMVPSAFVALEALPLTPNGKIDRKALPAPDTTAPRHIADDIAPSNALETTIADVWKNLLNLERVGLRENIFDLGANSLLTAQANQRLSEILGRKVSLVSMFRFPTVEALADHLQQAAPQPAPQPVPQPAPHTAPANDPVQITQHVTQHIPQQAAQPAAQVDRGLERKKDAAARRRELRGETAR